MITVAFDKRAEKVAVILSPTSLFLSPLTTFFEVAVWCALTARGHSVNNGVVREIQAAMGAFIDTFIEFGIIDVAAVSCRA